MDQSYQQTQGSGQAIREGSMTRTIEHQTARIPSIAFLLGAFGAIALSAGLAATSKRNREMATFVGQWVPTLLLLGIYNKIVKVEGSDKTERNLH